MIRTQLCPSSELENKNWWHVDIVIFVLIAALGYVMTENYFDKLRDEISRLQEKKTHWENELATKKTGLEKFKTLEAEIQLLNRKIGALKKITTSKIDNIKTLVVLDQLQTLWLESVWYEELNYSSTGNVKVV